MAESARSLVVHADDERFAGMAESVLTTEPRLARPGSRPGDVDPGLRQPVCSIAMLQPFHVLAELGQVGFIVDLTLSESDSFHSGLNKQLAG